MAAEIVIDDGGSTRIKQLGKKIDDIMDVAPNNVGSGPEPAAPGSKVRAFGDFDQLRIVTITNDGISTTTDKSLVAGNTFQVVSKGQQRIHGVLVAAAGGVAAHCLLTVWGISEVEPIVSGKTASGQRRYVVENAGRVKKVTVPGNDIDIDVDTVAYTTVVLRRA